MRKLIQQKIYFITELLGKSKIAVILPKSLTDLYCEATDDGGHGLNKNII